MAGKRFSIAGVVFNDDVPAQEPVKAPKAKKKASPKAKAPEPVVEATEAVEEPVVEEEKPEGDA